MSGIGLDATTQGGAPTTGQLAVDQQRNQMLATIAKALSVFASGGTITGNLTVTGTFTPNSIKGIVGTITNDNAQAGSVGEFISSTVLLGSAVSLSTTVAANITSIALSSGDWDVHGNIALAPGGGATATLLKGWTSTVSATNPTDPNNGADFVLQGNFTATQVMSVGIQRISIAAPTTIYLSALANFSGGSLSAFGFIGARRVR